MSEDKTNKMTEKELVDRTSKKLLASHNIVIHGAPGTGKTYLAKQVAASLLGIVPTEKDTDFDSILANNARYGFVQFHPSYDYTDFVEGLRPTKKEAGDIHFELVPGVFNKFLKYVNSNEGLFDAAWDYFSRLEKDNLKENYGIWLLQSEKYPDPAFGVDGKPKQLMLKDKMKAYCLEEAKPCLEDSGEEIDQDLLKAYKAFSNHIKERMEVERERKNPCVFIIDEVNRGDISKIFGELFFSIDPGYRGKKGEVLTQYDSMHPGESIYVPENVYIICTMNDIDRNVESFDFAMRRRFRFIGINPKDTQYMLAGKDERIKRMSRLNDVISKEATLGAAYQIGASYFLERIPDTELWSDHLEPLISEYLRGTANEAAIDKFKDAFYGKQSSPEESEA